MDLERFFGAGNRLKWQVIGPGNDGPLAREMQPFLRRISDGVSVVLLPRVDEVVDRVWWYVMWSENQQSRFVEDYLRAFLGESFSDLGKRRKPLDSSDPIESTVLSQFGDRAVRLEVPYEKRHEARRRLFQMISLLDQRPRRQTMRWRAVGRVLRDFEFALSHRDIDSAIASITELKKGGYLDARNIAYLELRALAASEKWAEVLEYPTLRNLLELGLPRRTVSVVIEAVFQFYLSRFEFDCDGVGALEVFREEVLPRYRALFRTDSNLSGYQVDACFLLLAAVGGTRRSEVHRDRCSAYPVGSVAREFLDNIARLIPDPEQTAALPSVDSISIAMEALQEDDIDFAFEVAVKAPHCRKRTAILIRAALEIQSKKSLLQAWGAWKETSCADDIEYFTAPVWERRLDNLKERLGVQNIGDNGVVGPSDAVSSWGEWFGRLTSEVPWPGATAAADLGRSDWSMEEFLSAPAAIDHACHVIGSALPPWAAEALRASMPSLVSTFSSSGDPRIIPVVGVMFELLATDEAISVPVAEAVVRMVSPRIQFMPGQNRYFETLDIAASVLERASSPECIPLVLSSLELVLDKACPSPVARTSFVARSCALLLRWQSRMSPVDLQLAIQCILELELDPAELLPVVKDVSSLEVDSWAALQGKTIAMYSLQEGALARAEKVIQKACPEVKIETFKDTVGGSSALRKAARNANLFVIVAGAATHAATDFIRGHRPSGGAIEYARGEGSTSLVTAVKKWALAQN